MSDHCTVIVDKGKKYNQNAGKSISDRKFGYVHGIKIC